LIACTNITEGAVITSSLPNLSHRSRGSNGRASRSSTFLSIVTSAVLLSAAPFFLGGAAAAQPGTPFGRWTTDNGNLEVEIAKCGEAICGTVVKVLANRSMSGSGEMVAADNRDPLGMVILKNFTPSSEGEWQGEIYNRENAKTYSCKLSLENPDQLIVRPYIGLPLFGKTLVWRRTVAASGEK
jgi:uncharacterized protein (DUF2147 family)